MDPNETLRRMRRIAELAENYPPRDVRDKLIELSELFDGLDQWMVGGGFLPSSWDAKRRGIEPAPTCQMLVILFGDGTTKRQVEVAAEAAQVTVKDLLRSACASAAEHRDVRDPVAAYNSACREMGITP